MTKKDLVRSVHFHCTFIGIGSTSVQNALIAEEYFKDLDKTLDARTGKNLGKRFSTQLLQPAIHRQPSKTRSQKLSGTVGASALTSPNFCKRRVFQLPKWTE